MAQRLKGFHPNTDVLASSDPETHTRRYKYWKVKIGCHQVIILVVVIIIIIIEIHVCFPSLNL